MAHQEIDLSSFDGPDAIPNANATPEPNLPPAGYQRDEELAKRTDILNEQGEKIYADVGKIDPSVLEADPEIRRDIAMNYLEIGLEHAVYSTKWVNYVNLQGQKVWEAKADGWIMATVTEFPEARDLRKADNSIRVGDVLLMFIRKDEHLKLLQREDKKRLRQQYGIEAEIHDLANATNRKYGTQVFAGVETPELGGNMRQEMVNAVNKRNSRQAGARRTAAEHLGNKMKEGFVPGIPKP